jgi:eukaryotic-like serine/threonine-protein kinase
VTSINPADDRAETVPQPAASGADDALLGETTPIPRAAAMDPLTSIREARPAEPPKSARSSALFWKIFLSVAGTVGLVLAITLVVGGVKSRTTAEASLHHGLGQTAKLITDLIKADEDNLAAKAKIYVSNPSIASVIEQTGLDSLPKGATPIDSGNFLDLAQTMAKEVGASWVQIIDRNGTRLARSDQQGAPVVDLSESPLVAKALGGETVHGFGITGDSVLFDAVSIPIGGAGKTVGVAMLARNISDSTAVRIMSLTGSEVVFFAIDPKNHVRIAGATPRLNDRTRTTGVLTGLIMADRKAADTSGSVGDMLMGMEMDSTMGSTMAKDNTIDGHAYVWTIKPLLTAAEQPRGGVVALRDKDEALAPFTAMQRAVLEAAAIALALAFLISIAVARQITRPVRALVGATMRATEGDYNAEIPESSGEIGALADAFRHLLEDLREKQSVVDFLQSPSGGKTVAAAARVAGATAPRGGGSAAQLEPGQLLTSRYEIKRVLGAGGMGMVYKATDMELGETVAIKTLRPEIMDMDPAALDRFRSEIRLARKISHRNVVRTHDIGESNGLYFITMEYVEGSSLKELILARGRLPAAAVIAIGKQLCRALEVAHDAGVIHRDIKPQNMVVEADGVLKVMDFGIARLRSRSDGHTQAGMVVGTPEYMSPEQLRGDELDERADLYSAGVVLYESLTGKLPHIADTPGALIGKVLSETPVPPRASVAEVSPALSAIILQALSKDREQRPRTALDLLALLEQA